MEEEDRDENNSVDVSCDEVEAVHETMSAAVVHEMDGRNCRVEEVVSLMEVAFVENESDDPNEGDLLVAVDLTLMVGESWAVEAQIHEAGNWDDAPIDLVVVGLLNVHVEEGGYCNNVHLMEVVVAGDSAMSVGGNILEFSV